jgi:hypothetical protein
MRKLLAATAICAICCHISHISLAQNKKHKSVFGFKAGANVSTFRTAVEYTDFDPSVKAGLVLGGFVEIPVSSHFLLQPQFLYSQMGCTASSGAWGDVKFKYNYFSLPLLVKYKVTDIFNVFAGPQADFLLRARKKDYFKTESITYVIRRDYDLGFTAGVELLLSKRVSADARYVHGIRDVSLTSDQNTFFNQGLQVAVGYKIFGKPKKAKKQKTK